VAEGHAVAAAEVKARAEVRAGALVELLEAELARDARPWLGEKERVAGPIVQLGKS
jgi:hypothetical protein